MEKSTDAFSAMSVDDSLRELQPDRKNGLAGAEAQKRLATFGHNEIPEKTESLIHRIVRRLWGPIPWMIEAAALLSALVGKWEDFSPSSGYSISQKVYMNLPANMVQSFVFLKLAIAAHLTIFVTRTRGRFWRPPYPSQLLFWASISTKVAATVFAVYGEFIAAIGWQYALLVWGYALAWFVVNDFIKFGFIGFCAGSGLSHDLARISTGNCLIVSAISLILPV
jgi:magnesium-transporting ATPase (P-type)